MRLLLHWVSSFPARRRAVGCLAAALIFICYSGQGDHQEMVLDEDDDCPSCSSSGMFRAALLNASSTSTTSKLKTILLFSPFEEFHFGFGRLPFLQKGCAVSNCAITANRSLLKSMAEFDAILFHPVKMALEPEPRQESMFGRFD